MFPLDRVCLDGLAQDAEVLTPFRDYKQALLQSQSRRVELRGAAKVEQRLSLGARLRFYAWVDGSGDVLV